MFNLVREAKLANIVKLANMLIDLFGLPEAFQKYVKPKRVGHTIEMHFPSLEGSITFVLTNDKEKYQAQVGKPNDPVAIIIIKEKREKVAKALGKLIRKKSNIFGIISLAPKIIARKIIIKKSLFAALSLCRIMMIGKNPIYDYK